ncbi:MAG TPA: hypothetical protein PLT11_07365, partial [Elusimicrobiota bacterium]|nr:hypothetical protein [Elusimicrobiota bacterium]
HQPRRNASHLWEAMREIRVLRFPRHRLATFGQSEISYQLVTSVSTQPARSTLRTGKVIAERPQILTPDAFVQRFKDFGEDSSAYERFLKDHFSDSLRGLEYNFRNILETTEPHHTDARELARNIRKDLDDRNAARAAVILGPESGWGFALMKFILEETSQSFAVNVRELDERGLFNPPDAEERRRREIEILLRRAESDPSLVKPLADLLNRHGLFNDYQDAFFRLVKRGAS